MNRIAAEYVFTLNEDKPIRNGFVEFDSDGTVTSVEVFDAYGDLMAMFFGARKPGKPELAPWRALATSLPRLDAQAVAA